MTAHESFRNAIRRHLASQPDHVLVGEIRDEASKALALEAATRYVPGGGGFGG